MKTALLLILLAGCSCSVGNSTVVNGPSSEDAVAALVRSTLPSVVKIEVEVEGIVIVGGKPAVPPRRSSTVWYGTGFVVRNDRGSDTSLVATANHVVDVPKEIDFTTFDGTPVKIAPVVWKYTAVTLSGRRCPGRSGTVFDAAADVAVFRTNCVPGPEVVLSQSPPEVGGRVLIVGAPEGYHPDGIFHVSDGIFLGADKDNDLVSTAPVLRGNSGSPLLYKGSVVGIVTKQGRTNGHMSYATMSRYLDPLIARAEKELR